MGKGVQKRRKLIYLILLILGLSILILSNTIISNLIGNLFGKPLYSVYSYESSDRNFACNEVPGKYDLKDVVWIFEKYKQKSGNINSELCRTFEKDILKFYNWWDYLTNSRWDYPYIEPSEKPNYKWRDEVK